MKFGALLRTSAQEMPELQGLFNCYKQLKKRLKRLPEKTAQRDFDAPPPAAVVAHERAFVALLVSDIQAFNETYVEKEEQSVIRLSLLEERLQQARREEERANLYKDFVNFHGQTLMLVHWSILAYTSVLKILKKHHKRTGLQVQEFNMQQLLSQPFCSVELTSELVRKAEAKAQELASSLNIVPLKTSHSFASSHSSPVAGELMTAARESVQNISDSAARGNEALEQHLTEQPSSSEDDSVDLRAQGEVVSSREPLQDTAQVDNARNGAGSIEPILEPSQGNKKRAKPEAEGSEQPGADKKRPRWTSLEGNRAIMKQVQCKHNCQLGRTLSIAGENQVQQREGLAPVNGASGSAGPTAEIEEATPSEKEQQEPDPAPSQAGTQNGTSGSSGSKSRSKSPQLTVGQGWFEGTSENILRQTQMALGLWEHLHETASTPSTVVPPLQRNRPPQQPANSAA